MRPPDTDTGIVAALVGVSTSPLLAARKDHSCPDIQTDDTTVADIVALSDIGAEDRNRLLVGHPVVAERSDIIVN